MGTSAYREDMHNADDQDSEWERLDHVHIRVPDRAEAARWYAEHLGFEPVDAYDFWATGFEARPLRSRPMAGGRRWRCSRPRESHRMVRRQIDVASSASDADSFISFARSLPSGIDNPRGEPLVLADLVDFDLCWAFDLVDRGETGTSSTATTRPCQSRTVDPVAQKS